MDREWGREDQFSDDVDRILAGKPIDIRPEQGDDYRADIEFAGELIRRRVNPSPAFEARLREKLLARLPQTSQLSSSRKLFPGWLADIRSPSAWRPALAVLLALVIVVSLFWSAGLLTSDSNLTPEIAAATIADNSPEVRAALDEEQVEVVKITQVVDQKGTVLMWSRTKAVMAKVDLKTEQVTEVIRVEVPEYTTEDEREAIELIKADPQAKALLDDGGYIVKVSPGRMISFNDVAGPDGKVQQEASVIMGASIVIHQGKEDWNAIVDLDHQKVMRVHLARNTGFLHVIDVFRDTGVPAIAAGGMVVLIGLLYFKRLPKVLTGVFSIIFGALSIPAVMYAARFTPAGLAPVFLIPILGLITGSLGLRNGKKWVSIPGIVLCSLALAYQIFITYITLR